MNHITAEVLASLEGIKKITNGDGLAGFLVKPSVKDGSYFLPHRTATASFTRDQLSGKDIHALAHYLVRRYHSWRRECGSYSGVRLESRPNTRIVWLCPMLSHQDHLSARIKAQELEVKYYCAWSDTWFSSGKQYNKLTSE